MPKVTLPTLLAIVLVVALAVAFPLLSGPFYVKVMMLGLLYAYLSSSWNIVGGYGGQISFAHGIFFALGSYAVALFAVHDVGPLIFAVLVGVILALAASYLVAKVCFGYALTGIHFVVGTMLLAEIVRVMAVNSVFLGRSQGLQVRVPETWWNLQFESYLPFYYILLAMTLAVTAFTWWFERSRLGHQVTALREQEASAKALGIDTTRAKQHAFMISAALTAVGGAMHALLIGFVEPGFNLGLLLALTIVMGAVLGGRGTVLGPIVGGFVVQGIQQGLVVLGGLFGTTSVSALAQVVYGLFFVVTILGFPRGIVGTIMRRRADAQAIASANPREAV